MAALRRRVCQVFSIPGFGAASKVSSSLSFQKAILDISGARHCSQLVKYREHFVDSLALETEGEGLPSKQAEVLIAVTTEVLENVSQALVSKEEMQKFEMMQEFNLSKFKVELQSSQGHHFSLLQHETEKLRNDLEKMGIELRHEIDKVRHEIDKVTAGQRSDFNLEMGKIKKELSEQMAETIIRTNKLHGLTSKLDRVSDSMTSKLDAGMDSLRAQLEAANYDNTKYFIGTIVSFFAVGFVVLRQLM